MKLEIDERGGCIAVVDADKRGDRSGLHSDDPHVLWYEMGECPKKTCPTCCQPTMGSWQLKPGARDRAEAEMQRLIEASRKENDNG